MKQSAVLAVLLLALLGSGCQAQQSIYANSRAIEELQTVQTLGLDSHGSGVAVTAAVGKVGEDAPAAVLHRSGQTVPLALRSLQDHTLRGQLFFAHTRYVLLGRAQAEAGFSQLLDYTERDVLTRMGASVLVLRSGAAADAMAAIGDGDQILALLNSIQQDTETQGGSRVTDLRNTAVALSEYGAALVCALQATDTADSLLSDGPALSLTPCGYGIVKDSAVVGYLTDGDAETAGFLIGHPGKVTRCYPVEGGGTVTLELRSTGAELHWGDDGIALQLHLQAVLAAAEDVTVPITQGAAPQLLSQQVSDQVRTEVLGLLERARALDADFLALARQLRRQGADLSDGWLERAEFRVTVETVLDHSSDLGEPLHTGGEAA